MSAPLALSGFMGAGKTSIGRRLARSRGLVFVDLDVEIEAAFARSIPEIFARFGEAAFRAMELRLLRQALALPDRVVALGGGAVASPEARALLTRDATWVHLAVPFHELQRRVRADRDSARPLWSDPEAARRLYDARAPLYAEAPLQIDAEGPPDVVARSIASRLEGTDTLARRPADHPAERLRVPIPGEEYDVVVGRGLEGVADAVGGVGDGPIAVLTDWNVGPLHLDALLAALRTTGRPLVSATLPAGEEHKGMRPVLDAVDRLLDAGWQRRAPVVALGGGVLGDMAGLVAALVLRGVPFVQVPTTLLAMVDSSVGGKVGVNHRRGKNLIGQFHQPALVWTDLAYLDTLEDRELRAGLGEVVKTALIGDPELLARLEADPDAYLRRDPATLADAVLRCCRVKARIVAEDAHERGRRALLNLGHTVGHGLEVVCGYGRLRHGEAVAIGLVAAAALGSALGVTDPGLTPRLTSLLSRLGLPTQAPAVDITALANAISRDKKLKGDSLQWILMDETGEAAIRALPVHRLQEHLAQLVAAGVLEARGGG